MIGLITKLVQAMRTPRFLGNAHMIFQGWGDHFKTKRAPTKHELLHYYGGVGYISALMNASVAAEVELKLFVGTKRGQKAVDNYHVLDVTPAQKSYLVKSSQIPRRTKASTRIQEIAEHPMLDLMDTVNPHMDHMSLREYTQLYLDVVGLCYWYLDLAVLDVPSAIWLLPPQYVEPKRSEATLLSHYDFMSATGKNEKLDPRQVIAFRTPNLREPYLSGYSVTEATLEILDSVSTDIATAFAMMKNRNRPDLLVTPKGEAVGRKEASRMKRRLEQLLARGRAGSTLVTTEAMDVKQLAVSPKDMEALARLKVNADLVRNAYGTPLALFSERTNLANLRASMVQHYKYAIVPRLRRLVTILNKCLIPLYDNSGRMFLGFDSPVPEDEREKAFIRATNIKAKVSTPDEERETMGREPLEDEAGAQIFVGTGEDQWKHPDDREDPRDLMEPGQESGDGDQPPKPEDDDKKKPKEDVKDDGKKGYSNEGLGALQSGQVGVLARMDDEGRKTLYAAVAAHFGGQLGRAETLQLLVSHGVDKAIAYDWLEPLVPLPAPEELCSHTKNRAQHSRRIPEGSAITKTLRALFKKQRIAVLDRYKIWTKNFEPVDLSGWDEEFKSRLYPGVELGYNEGLKEAISRYGVTDDIDMSGFNVANPKVVEAVEQQTIVLSQSTNKTTSLMVNDAIDKLKQEIADGLISSELAPISLTKRVQQVFEFAEKHRAERIAKTEASRALHAAQRLAAEESGVVKGFEWLLSADACPFCKEIKDRYDKGIGLKGDFGTATSYKHGPKAAPSAYNTITGPPAHPHCRCTLLEKLDFEKGAPDWAEGDEDDG